MRSARCCFNLVLAGLCLAFSRPTPASEPPAPPAKSTPAASETRPKSAKARKPKPIKVLRVHVESRRDLPQRSLPAPVGRSEPMIFRIEKLPILIEQNVDAVTLVDQPDGFQVRIQFDSTGTRILESYTAAAVGRHLILATEIDGEVRWLAAPLLRHRIGDGTLTFTPDASREEMERMALDLAKAKRKERRNRWIQ